MRKIILILPILCLIGCSNAVDFKVNESSQNFAQDIKYNKTVDILFVIDNSLSMNLVQQQLNEQIPFLFDSLMDLNMDVHIGFTSTTMIRNLPEFSDQGRLIGEPKYLTKDTPDLLNQITQRIAMGDKGATIEEGLLSMETVLSDAYLQTEGRGFLRPDSFLNIIVLSNEDDSSPSGWEYYAQLLDKLRPNHADGTKSWALNFFGVLSLSDSCSSSEWGFKIPGLKYMELVKYSGGVQGSLCGRDLFRSVSSIKARIVQILTDYKLDKKPKIETIRVYVNDQLVPNDSFNGWSLIESLNLIRFNGTAVPKANDSIKVDYLPLEAD